MNTQITVDADLLKQAMQITHTQNSQILIEKILRLLIQTQPNIDDLELSDWTKNLIGLIPSDENESDEILKQNYTNYLEQKYS